MQVQLLDQTKPLSTKIYCFFYYHFISVNLAIQIIFFMYKYKIGINQDKYSCFVNLSQEARYPCAYHEAKKEMAALKTKCTTRIDAVNVTDHYDKIFENMLFLYIVFNMYLTLATIRYWQGVHMQKIGCHWVQLALWLVFILGGVF